MLRVLEGFVNGVLGGPMRECFRGSIVHLAFLRDLGCAGKFPRADEGFPKDLMRFWEHLDEFQAV